jgi:hypothetical protein
MVKALIATEIGSKICPPETIQPMSKIKEDARILTAVTSCLKEALDCETHHVGDHLCMRFDLTQIRKSANLVHGALQKIVSASPTLEITRGCAIKLKKLLEGEVKWHSEERELHGALATELGSRLTGQGAFSFFVIKYGLISTAVCRRSMPTAEGVPQSILDIALNEQGADEFAATVSRTNAKIFAGWLETLASDENSDGTNARTLRIIEGFAQYARGHREVCRVMFGKKLVKKLTRTRKGKNGTKICPDKDIARGLVDIVRKLYKDFGKS